MGDLQDTFSEGIALQPVLVSRPHQSREPEPALVTQEAALRMMCL